MSRPDRPDFSRSQIMGQLQRGDCIEKNFGLLDDMMKLHSKSKRFGDRVFGFKLTDVANIFTEPWKTFVKEVGLDHIQQYLHPPYTEEAADLIERCTEYIASHPSSHGSPSQLWIPEVVTIAFDQFLSNPSQKVMNTYQLSNRLLGIAQIATGLITEGQYTESGIALINLLTSNQSTARPKYKNRFRDRVTQTLPTLLTSPQRISVMFSQYPRDFSLTAEYEAFAENIIMGNNYRSACEKQGRTADSLKKIALPQPIRNNDQNSPLLEPDFSSKAFQVELDHTSFIYTPLRETQGGMFIITTPTQSVHIFIDMSTHSNYWRYLVIDPENIDAITHNKFVTAYNTAIRALEREETSRRTAKAAERSLRHTTAHPSQETQAATAHPQVKIAARSYDPDRTSMQATETQQFFSHPDTPFIIALPKQFISATKGIAITDGDVIKGIKEALNNIESGKLTPVEHPGKYDYVLRFKTGGTRYRLFLNPSADNSRILVVEEVMTRNQANTIYNDRR